MQVLKEELSHHLIASLVDLVVVYLINPAPLWQQLGFQIPSSDAYTSGCDPDNHAYEEITFLKPLKPLSFQSEEDDGIMIPRYSEYAWLSCRRTGEIVLERKTRSSPYYFCDQLIGSFALDSCGTGIAIMRMNWKDVNPVLF
jgi:hypothetical protein